MIIHKNPMVDAWNPPPRTSEEKGWYRKHQQELKTAQDKNICPACKRELSKSDTVFDMGYLYGIECEHCR